MFEFSTRLRVARPYVMLFFMLILVSPTQAPLHGAQTPRHKTVSPEQVKFQQQIEEWRTARAAPRSQATAALNAEMEREKTGDCPHADSTRAADDCLTQEIATTQKNYQAFTSALRSMLGLAYPMMPGERPASGPTGTPQTAAESVAEFERLEAASEKDRELAATVAYNQFKGGTEAPVFFAEAEQKVLRLHLQELAFLYGETALSNH